MLEKSLSILTQIFFGRIWVKGLAEYCITFKVFFFVKTKCKKSKKHLNNNFMIIIFILFKVIKLLNFITGVLTKSYTFLKTSKKIKFNT